MKERYNTWNYTFWHWRQMTITTHFEDEETEPRQGNTSHLRDNCSVETVLLTPPMPTGEKGCFQYMVTVPGTDFCGHPLCVTRIVSRAPSHQVMNSWEAPNSFTRSTCVGRGRTTHCRNHKATQTYHYTLQAPPPHPLPLRPPDPLSLETPPSLTPSWVQLSYSSQALADTAQGLEDTMCNKCISNRNFSFSVSPVSRSLGLLSEHLCLSLKKQKTKTQKKISYGSLHLVIDFSIPPSSLVSTCSWSSTHIHGILPWSQSLPSFSPTPILPSPWVPLVPLVFIHLTTRTTPPFLSPRCPQLYSAIHSSALTQDFVTAQYCPTSNTFDLKLQITQWLSHRKMVKLL